MLTREDISQSLARLGLRPGDAVMVHSSLSSLGHVDGGADTVVDALLETLGPSGTLVVPTFTFSLMRAQHVVFDLAQTPSGMGQITEVTRRRPGAIRSPHFISSVAAIGPLAEVIACQHDHSQWGCDGPYWQLYAHDARILMLGVAYARCTQFHFVEQLVVARYREWYHHDVLLRDGDGTERSLTQSRFSPRPGFPGLDFNKLGRILDDRGVTRIGPIGNAVSRLVRVRDIVEIGIAEYRRDPELFVRTDGVVTPLEHGVTIGDYHNHQTVLDPEKMYRRSLPEVSN